MKYECSEIYCVWWVKRIIYQPLTPDNKGLYSEQINQGLLLKYLLTVSRHIIIEHNNR